MMRNSVNQLENAAESTHFIRQPSQLLMEPIIEDSPEPEILIEPEVRPKYKTPLWWKDFAEWSKTIRI